MKHKFILGFIAFLSILLLSCTPPESTKSSEQLFLEETDTESAIAGQAIQLGACPQTRVLNSCIPREDGSYDTTTIIRGNSVTRNIRNSCRTVGQRTTAFQVLGCGPVSTRKGQTITSIDVCSFECEADELCENGFCIGPETRECLDTDNGDNRITQGTVTGILGSNVIGVGNRGEEVTQSDTCSGTTHILEWVCNTETNFTTRLLRDCPAGTECQEGACVVASTPEICDGADNNVNGQIDEGCDDDNDGICDASMTRASPYTCGNSNSWSSTSDNCCPWGGGDCVDTNREINTNSREICTDSVDNNCNGLVNENCETVCDDLDNNENGFVDDGCPNWDSDDYCGNYNYNLQRRVTFVGTPAICPSGGGDCNDGVASVYPGAPENCFDSEDSNCDGVSDFYPLSGCSPFTCTVITENSIQIQAANGEIRVNGTNTDYCSGGTMLVHPICRSASGTNLWSLAGSTNTTCPSGCTDPDGIEGPTPAVCS